MSDMPPVEKCHQFSARSNKFTTTGKNVSGNGLTQAFDYISLPHSGVNESGSSNSCARSRHRAATAAKRTRQLLARSSSASVILKLSPVVALKPRQRDSKLRVPAGLLCNRLYCEFRDFVQPSRRITDTHAAEQEVVRRTKL